MQESLKHQKIPQVIYLEMDMQVLLISVQTSIGTFPTCMDNPTKW